MGIKATPADVREWAAKGLIPAGKAPPRPGKLPPSRPPKAVALAPRPLRWSVTFEVPCMVVSEMNERGHWSNRERRRTAQREAVDWALAVTDLLSYGPPLPCRVVMTRLGGRSLDDDNLRSAFKHIRDKLAEWIGLDDADPRVEWVCEQRIGRKGVVVTIEGGHS